MLLTTKNIAGEQTFLMDDIFKTNILPLCKRQAKKIDNDIRACIKKEIKERGSIVKRYGDWAKFIGKEFRRVILQNHDNIYFREEIYYRNNLIGKYEIVTKENN